MEDKELFEILDWAERIAEDLDWQPADLDPEEFYRWEHCTEL